ncbi:MAG: hypothetical protein Fur0022_08730 [Anaerolineales bacterium]
MTCVYINPQTNPFWIIDDRLYDSTGDGKTKLDHGVRSTQRTAYIVINEIAQNNVEAVRDVCGFRWKVEQFHLSMVQIYCIESLRVEKRY